MGGLKYEACRSHLRHCSLIGWLAICGLPPFSLAFFSKDEILYQAFSSPSKARWRYGRLGALTAVMTAFYMSRLFSLTFFGNAALR